MKRIYCYRDLNGKPCIVINLLHKAPKEAHTKKDIIELMLTNSHDKEEHFFAMTPIEALNISTGLLCAVTKYEEAEYLKQRKRRKK